MTINQSQRPAVAGVATGNDPGGWARVWDLPTRLFHWVLVVSVAVALITGFVAPEWWMGVHSVAGYIIVALVVFRVVWALFGGAYSRIASFAYGPGRVLEHLRGAMLLRPRHYLGHNPAGAVMILILFATLTGLTVTGLMCLGGEEKQGVLAGWVSYATGNGAKVVHEALAFGLLGMIAAHVIGVAVESLLSRTNLVGAMISGRKRLNAAACDAPSDPRPARPFVAALSLVTVAVALAPVLTLAARTPPTGVYDLAMDPVYAAECGDCHYAYHPSLLPARSWDGMMAALDDHFGEDASLGTKKTAAIRAWLVSNASENWDTEAANRFRVPAPDAPWEITATAYWKRKHGDIAATDFKRKAVGGKGNCIACHGDADSGRFDDQAISIPDNK